jgi:hypothetical protein
MQMPKVGELWRPREAPPHVLYVCIQRDVVRRRGVETTVYKFQRLDTENGIKIKRENADILGKGTAYKGWEFVQ